MTQEKRCHIRSWQGHSRQEHICRYSQNAAPSDSRRDRFRKERLHKHHHSEPALRSLAQRCAAYTRRPEKGRAQAL